MTRVPDRRDPPPPRDGPFVAAVFAAVVAALLWSAWRPRDVTVWFLETFPVLLALPLLGATRRRFPLSRLAYAAVALHAGVLLVGAKTTYAETPAGFWIKDLLGLERNPWDRVGHVAQGVFPAILAREVILRTTPLRPGGWLLFLVTSVCLAIAAAYELLEWAVAVLGPDEEGISFLAMQGDPWDTQWDMFLALCGAVAVQPLVARWHDREIARATGGLLHTES